MKLDENYTIESDSSNFTLKYSLNTGTINKKSGKEVVTSNEWYFPKLKMALSRYANEVMKVPDSVQELIRVVGELENRISKINNK